MAIDMEEYTKLKKRAESLKSQADRARGALDQHMKKLKEDFDCDSLDDARELVDELEQKQNKIENDYLEALSGFKEKWNSQLFGET